MLQERLSELPERFLKTKRLLVRLKYPELVSIAELTSIEGVKEVRKRTVDVFHIEVISEDRVVEVSDYLARKKAGILEFRTDAMSLEDIFIKVVSEDVPH